MPESGSAIRWLVTGAGGLLGHDLSAVLADRTQRTPDTVTEVAGRAQLDITDATAVADAVAQADVVINAAAWTDVDGAESDEDGAYAGNATGPANLAAACAKTGARLIHVSTDYVFDGTATTPYAEDAPTGPRSAYGRTKLAGEQAIAQSGARAYVVRTAWVYGEHGKSFVTTMCRLAAGDGPVRVVDDQTGSPTWSHDLAAGLVELGANPQVAPGIYHATNAGEVTWYGLARAVFAGVGGDPKRVEPTTTAEFPRPAPRPSYSVLSNARWAAAGLTPLRPWPNALAKFLLTMR